VIRAYCWASGLIEFGQNVPHGALLIAKGPESELREIVGVVARRAWDGVSLLVPGVPEALDGEDALHGLSIFLDQIRTRVTPESRLEVAYIKAAQVPA